MVYERGVYTARQVMLQVCPADLRNKNKSELSVVLGIRIPACSLVPGTSPLGKGREAYAHILHFAHLHVRYIPPSAHLIVPTSEHVSKFRLSQAFSVAFRHLKLTFKF